MAPPRKSKSLNDRFSYINEDSPEKDASISSKHRKKKLSNKLGPKWSKEEIERFYEAYRTFGQDWKKVAAIVRNRSIKMVEALYKMNKAYLSLPDGTASVVGLIAMMTDHYNVLGSDNEQENDNALGAQRHKKRKREVKMSVSKDHAISHSFTSSDGCLSFLKRRCINGSQPRAVGKRTPRFPVSYLYTGEDDKKINSPNEKERNSDVDVSDDEVARRAALLLTEASRRGGSLQVSESAYRRIENIKSSPEQSWGRMHTKRGKLRAKLHNISRDEDLLEVNRGGMRAANGDYAKDSSSLVDRGHVATGEIFGKVKKCYEKHKVEEIKSRASANGRQACSETAEGHKISVLNGKLDVEVDLKSGQFFLQDQRKKNKKLLFGDEGTALDALQTLADLSLMIPASSTQSESFVQVKEDTYAPGLEDKSTVHEPTSRGDHIDRVKLPGVKENVLSTISAVEGTSEKCKLGKDSPDKVVAEGKEHLCYSNKTWKSKRMFLVSKVLNDPCEPSKTEVKFVEENQSMNKADEVKLPTKQGSRSRYKMNLQRKLIPKEVKSFENKLQKYSNKYSASAHSRAAGLKEKLSYCLSSSLVRRWCTFEWFYSAIDYPWYAKREFVEYLNHVGLEDVPLLTRVEWSFVRSSLGKPKRFSEHFLCEEREKLKHYRESVRKHYFELRSGTREGLPTDLARPLYVGQRVLALHPKTREVHDGIVLTVDHDKCRIQFDNPEMGVELVMDIDCMPSNPSDNMPVALRCREIAIKCEEPQINEHPKFGGSLIFASSKYPEKTTSPSPTINALVKQSDTDHPMLQFKEVPMDPATTRQSIFRQPYPVSEATCASNKKVSSNARKLKKHHTYPRSLSHSWLKRPANSSQESASSVIETVQASRLKAHMMVNAAIQALSSRKEGEDAFTRIEESLNSICDQPLTSETRSLVTWSHEHIVGTLGNYNPFACKLEPPQCTSDASAPNSHLDSERNDSHIPSELITSCVASLLMIQSCTESGRQYPPADVAQILNSAVTSLHPYCPQNLPIYREIQMCIGKIKTKILALIPT